MIEYYAFMCAITGFVYSIILTEPDMILYPVWKFLDNRLHPVIFKPLMDCYKCVCGQIALWMGLFIIHDNSDLMRVFTHLYFICLTIFVSIILNKIYERIKNN